MVFAHAKAKCGAIKPVYTAKLLKGLDLDAIEKCWQGIDV